MSILAPDRCPVCDRTREGCAYFRIVDLPETEWLAIPISNRTAVIDECEALRVDWRARALKAEALIAEGVRPLCERILAILEHPSVS